MRKVISMIDPYCCKECEIKFILRIDGQDVEVPQSMMVLLASNTQSELNHFLAGYFRQYPDFKDDSNIWK